MFVGGDFTDKCSQLLKVVTWRENLVGTGSFNPLVKKIKNPGRLYRKFEELTG